MSLGKSLSKICVLLISLVLCLASPTLAQSVSEPVENPDIQAINQVLKLLQDNGSRAKLIRELEALRDATSQLPTNDASTKTNNNTVDRSDDAEATVLNQSGLVEAVAGWVSDVGTKLPNATLGVPINVKIA